MSRIVGRAKSTERNGMKVTFSEAIIMIAVVIAVIFGVRWYFSGYLKSPGYALGEYFGYVKKGNVEKQYEMIDASDKQQFFPTVKKYENDAPMARGYNMRIQDVKMSEPILDPKNPNVVKVPCAITVRDSADGKELYQQGTKTVEDEYTLRKNNNGEWKIWLQKSKRDLLNKVKPSDKSTY